MSAGDDVRGGGMSERGSICTEFIYCEECAKAVNAVLQRWARKPINYPTCVSIGDDTPHITAIFTHASASGLELVDWDIYMRSEIASVICHPVRLAVFPEDNGTEFVEVVKPDVRQ